MNSWIFCLQWITSQHTRNDIIINPKTLKPYRRFVGLSHLCVKHESLSHCSKLSLDQKL